MHPRNTGQQLQVKWAGTSWHERASLLQRYIVDSLFNNREQRWKAHVHEAFRITAELTAEEHVIASYIASLVLAEVALPLLQVSHELISVVTSAITTGFWHAVDARVAH